MDNNNEKKYVRAKTWQMAAFALNNTASNSAFFMMTFYMFFNQNILGLSAVVVGAIATAMRIFDGITDPFCGYIMDKTNGRFGKFRPFMVIGNLMICVTIYLIFNAPLDMSANAKYVYTAGFYAIYVLGYTMQNAVTKGAQAALTNDPKQRPIFSIFDATYNTILYAVGPWLLTTLLARKFSVGAYEGGKGLINPDLWHTASIIFIVFMVVCTWIAIFAIKDRDTAEFYETKSDATLIKFSHFFDILKGNAAIRAVILADVFDKFAAMLMNGILVYVFANIFLNSALQGTFSLVSIIPALAITLFGVNRGKKVGLRTTYLTGVGGSFCSLVVMILIMVVFGTNMSTPWIFLSVYIIQKGFMNMSGNIVIPIIGDISDYELARSGRFSPGMIGTLFSFADKCVSSLSSLVTGFVLAAAGMANSIIEPNVDYGSQFNTAILIAFCGIPAICNVISFMSMKFLYPLTKEKMNEVQTKNLSK